MRTSSPTTCSFSATALRPDRLLLRLHRHAGLRRRDLSQLLVLRAGPRLQRHQGPRAAAGAANRCVRCRMKSAPHCRCSPAAAALRFLLTRLVDFPQCAAGCARCAEGPARILPQAALPSGGRQRPRLRDRRMNDAPKRPHVVVYTDGGCAPIPDVVAGPRILRSGERIKELEGGEVG